MKKNGIRTPTLTPLPYCPTGTAHHQAAVFAPVKAHLASERSRAGVGVRCRLGVVDVDEDTRVGSLVRARERHEVAGRAAAAASDGELSARQVKLSATGALRHVKGNLLVAHEVVARWQARGHGHIDGRFA